MALRTVRTIWKEALGTAEKTTQLMLRINGTTDLSIATEKEYPEKCGWWISELNSLGVKTEAKNAELRGCTSTRESY